MTSRSSLARVAILTAVALLAAGPVRSQSATDPRTPKQKADDEANARRICATAEETYRAAEREYNEQWLLLNQYPTDSIQRTRVIKLHAALLQAIAKYCDCMRSTYAKAKLPLPPDYERLCVRPPGVAPPPSSPGVAPPQRPPADTPARDAPPRAPAAEQDCSQARKAYLEAREAWIRAGRPFLGFEAAVMGREIDRTGRAYCECLRLKHGGKLPPEIARFCRSFDGSAQIDPPERPMGPEMFDPPLPPDEPPPGAGGPIRRDRPGWQFGAPQKTPGSSDPPPPPVAPPAPGAGGGGVGGATGSTPRLQRPGSTPEAAPPAPTSTPRPVPTATPALPPAPEPTEVGMGLWQPRAGHTFNVSVRVVRHDGSHVPGTAIFHDPESCAELARLTSIRILTAGADSFSLGFDSQSLPCERVGRTNSFRCQGTFSRFGSLSNVPASIDPFSVNGSVRGTLNVGTPGGGIVYSFTGGIQP